MTPGVSAAPRQDILQLLSRSKYDAKEFVAKLSDSDRTTWEEMSGETRSDPLQLPIASEHHTDELWGMYLACGGFEPIRRLCDALSPEETGAVDPGSLRDEDTGALTPMRKLIPETVRRDLVEDIPDDKLLGQYCRWIVNDTKSPKGVREALRKVLETK